MGRGHAKDGLLLLDEFDFSGVIMAVDIVQRTNNEEVLAFADTAMVKVEGQPGWTLSASGLWSPSSPAYDSEIFADLTAVDRLLNWTPLGRTDGNRSWFGKSNVSRAPIPTDTGSHVALDVDWIGDDSLVFGYLLDTETAEVASGNGTAYQVGAISATQEGVGFLHVLSSGGDASQTLDVVIASDDVENFGGTPETQITFTQATTAATSQRVTVAGAVTDDWWRAQTTVAGTGSPTFSFVCCFGIVTAAG